MMVSAGMLFALLAMGNGAPIDLEMGPPPAAAGIYKIINESASAANS